MIPHYKHTRHVRQHVMSLCSVPLSPIPCQVAEVLLPLCRAPSIKSALTEHKAAGVLGKGVYAVVRPLQDLQQLQADEAAAAAAAATRAPTAGPGLARLGVESQALAGVLLQLVGVLMDPDISMNPWADR